MTPCECGECDCTKYADPGSDLCIDCDNDDHDIYD